MKKATAVARMRRVHASHIPSLPVDFGVLAQLGERLICIQEVRSSILLGSTRRWGLAPFGLRHPRDMVARHMPQNHPLDDFAAPGRGRHVGR
jgi:hypothetical protein